MTVTKFKRPLYRRIGLLVVRLDSKGLSIRGAHKRQWRFLSWNRIATLIEDGDGSPLLNVAEEDVGRQVLHKLTAPVKAQRKT